MFGKGLAEMLNKCPCYQCEERHIGCHSDCRRYLDWKAENDAARKREQEWRAAERTTTERIIRCKKRKR